MLVFFIGATGTLLLATFTRSSSENIFCTRNYTPVMNTVIVKKSFYLVTSEELERQLPSIRECGWETYGAMSYERWKHHPHRSLNKKLADLIVFPPFLTDELNWPVYSGGNWDHNFARPGKNPGSSFDQAGECSVALESFIRTEYQFYPGQRYLLHMGSCGWDRGYALPSEAYQDERAIVAKGNALYEFHRKGIDISLPPPFTDVLTRFRWLHSAKDENEKTYLLAFKGGLDNSPVRREVQKLLHDPARGALILPNDDETHDYWELLSSTTFALVIRGHVSFSYRLSEVVCSGAIPVLLADDWVPPFDDIVPFEEYGVRLGENDIGGALNILTGIGSARRRVMSDQAVAFCQGYLISPWHQFDGLMQIALSRFESTPQTNDSTVAMVVRG